MSKLNEIDLYHFFKSDADSIRLARTNAIQVHGSNIRSGGNEVEIAVRQFVQSRLPGKYRVGQGHLINTEHKVSPQIDILITDNHTLPIMIETKDKTEFFSCESVYAIGEVKSTYRLSDKPISNFCETIGIVKNDMGRVTEKNTSINGQLSDDTDMNHWYHHSPNETMNPILSFLFFANSGNFKPEHFIKIVKAIDSSCLPNIIVFLDYGLLFQAVVNDRRMSFSMYPEYNKKDVKWYLTRLDNDLNNPGLHLAFLYYYLIQHLEHCHLNPPDYYSYFKKAFMLKNSLTTPLE
jgi:hypothetical protein